MIVLNLKHILLSYRKEDKIFVTQYMFLKRVEFGLKGAQDPS